MNLRARIHRLPSAYTLFTKLLNLRDWVTSPASRTRHTTARRPARLTLEPVEERIVPVHGGLPVNVVPVLGSGIIGSTSGSDGGNPGVSAISPAGVNYADGDVVVNRVDLSSSAFGTTWAQGGSWSNLPGYAPTNTNGNGWMNPQMPFLENPNGNNSTIIAVTGGNSAEYFTLSGSTYTDADFMLNTLVHTGATFVLTDTTGDQITFNDFSSSVPTAEQGQFVSMTDPYGNVTSVYSYTSAGLPSEIRQTSPSSSSGIESFLYSYVSSGVNVGLLQSVDLRQSTNDGGIWTDVQNVQYTYYDGTTSFGNAGDLETATIENPSSNVISTYYYRYYTSSTDGTVGYTHGLEYELTPQAYAQLAGTGVNPLTATNTQLAPYASYAYQYNSSQQVTQVVVAGAGGSATGGLGTYTYSYTSSDNAAGYNSWAKETVETLPNGSTNTVFTNSSGEVMLKVFHDAGTGLTYDSFTEYDSAGRVILTAEPSAVTGYSTSDPTLLGYSSGSYADLSNSSGLITTDTYYSSTTATATAAGGVAGYLESTSIQQGQTGTPVEQSSTQYYQDTAGSVTIDPIATSTVYSGTGGTGAETTSYTYRGKAANKSENTELLLPDESSRLDWSLAV